MNSRPKLNISLVQSVLLIGLAPILFLPAMAYLWLWSSFEQANIDSLTKQQEILIKQQSGQIYAYIEANDLISLRIVSQSIFDLPWVDSVSIVDSHNRTLSAFGNTSSADAMASHFPIRNNDHTVGKIQLNLVDNNSRAEKKGTLLIILVISCMVYGLFCLAIYLLFRERQRALSVLTTNLEKRSIQTHAFTYDKHLNRLHAASQSMLQELADQQRIEANKYLTHGEIIHGSCLHLVTTLNPGIQKSLSDALIKKILGVYIDIVKQAQQQFQCLFFNINDDRSHIVFSKQHNEQENCLQAIFCARFITYSLQKQAEKLQLPILEFLNLTILIESGDIYYQRPQENILIAHTLLLGEVNDLKKKNDLQTMNELNTTPAINIDINISTQALKQHYQTQDKHAAADRVQIHCLREEEEENIERVFNKLNG